MKFSISDTFAPKQKFFPVAFKRIGFSEEVKMSLSSSSISTPSALSVFGSFKITVRISPSMQITLLSSASPTKREEEHVISSNDCPELHAKMLLGFTMAWSASCGCIK